MPRLNILCDVEAWSLLPGGTTTPQPLPTWARQLARIFPLTTARMLELDAVHRTGERLDARLRSVVRHAVADANECEYAKAVASADLRRDLGDERIESINDLERAVVAFARQMMLAAHSVTDDDVRGLIDILGEERVMALVALLAHASFQDRIILALQSPSEPPNGTPPLIGRLPRPAMKPAAPKPAVNISTTPNPASSAEWNSLRLDLEDQYARLGRIRIPTPDEMLARIGRDHPSAWQTGIVWSRVCFGYQPVLADAWFDTVAAFRAETSLGPIVSNFIFWVVTQSVKCFY